MDILMLLLVLVAIALMLGLMIRVNRLDKKISAIQKSLGATSQDEYPPEPPPPPPKPPIQP
ncbi:hypothetical protein JXQ31_15905 [candidate division KSB1 bacterium]|nr:hypothetical protein [candidate division KSB1 bacterium]